MIKLQVTVYSTTTCPYCKMLKEYLDKNNVSYAKKVVDTNDAAREEMLKVSGGFLGVPFTTITREDGKMETIVGFDKNKINQLLNLKE